MIIRCNEKLGGGSNRKILNSIEQFNELRNNGKHIFMFSADWCGDCRFIEPFLPDIEANYNEYTFVHIDRDQFIDLCVELNVFGIPSFIAFEDGRRIRTFR